jgi:hypothetical protein
MASNIFDFPYMFNLNSRQTAGLIGCLSAHDWTIFADLALHAASLAELRKLTSRYLFAKHH